MESIVIPTILNLFFLNHIYDDAWRTSFVLLPRHNHTLPTITKVKNQITDV